MRRTLLLLSLLVAAACTGPPKAPDADLPYVELPRYPKNPQKVPTGPIDPGLLDPPDRRTTAPPGVRPEAPDGPDAAPAPATGDDAAAPRAPSPIKGASRAGHDAYEEVISRRLEKAAGGVRVLVEDGSGAPVEDVRVRYLNLAWSWEGGGMFPFVATDITELRTDGDGVAAFPRAGTRAIFAYAEGASGVACGISHSPGDFKRPPDLRLTLEPGKVVRGRVLDPEGRPVPGASVEFQRSEKDAFLDISRPDGRFAGVRLPLRYLEGMWRLRVGAPGFDLHESTVDGAKLAAGPALDVRLTRE